MKRARGFRALAIALLLLAVIAGPHDPTASAAATITVTTTGDELNTDGDCSLREAIQAANTDTAVDACTAGSGADSISLPSGTYTLAVSGPNEDANATGDLDITGDSTLTGAGSGSTTVRGPAGWEDRIFDVGLLANAAVTISGLTVSGGNSDASGAGIRGNGFSLDLTLSGVVLAGNTAAGEGGGLFSSSLGTLVLTNVTATGNTSVSNGGGIRTANASSAITNLALTDNQTIGAGEGGGLYAQDQSATITGLTATGNTATGSGGGLSLSSTATGGVLEDATISGNSTGNPGGGVFVGENWTIRRASITGNQSGSEGGGIQAVGGGTLIQDTTIDGNTALTPTPCCGLSVGGGIFGLGFTLERVAVTNNSATGFGGGIAVGCCLATHFTNVTISGNSRGGFSGGGRDTSTAPVLRNVTIANNFAGDCEAGTPSQCGSAIDTLGGVVVLENVIVSGPAPLCSNFEDTSPRPEIVSNGHNLYSGPCVLVMGPGDRIADPLLGPLADNGGPTKTHALLPGSPAIDPHGPSDPGPSNCPATDQRGVARPQDGDLDGTPICDIGAFEFVPAGVDGAMDVIVSGPTKSVASGGSRKVFVTKVCNQGTAGVTVDPVKDIATSITVEGEQAGGTVTVTDPSPMILRPGACQRYRWEWSYGEDGPATSGDTVEYEATWNLAGDGFPANNIDSETRTAT